MSKDKYMAEFIKSILPENYRMANIEIYKIMDKFVCKVKNILSEEEIKELTDMFEELNKKGYSFFDFIYPLPLIRIVKDVIDPIKIDDLLGKTVEGYEPDKCKYQEWEEVSMNDFIKLRYRKNAASGFSKIMNIKL